MARRGALRELAFPLQLVNLVMYALVVWFASWNLNQFINGHHAGNAATSYFLQFSVLAGVVGTVSILPNLNVVAAWGNGMLATTAASAIVAWAITVLAFGFACKEIQLRLHRHWRQRALESLVTILAATQLLYVLMLHSRLFNPKKCPGRSDPTGEGGRAPENPSAAPAVQELE